MRWWNWILLLSPAPLVAAAIRLNWAIGWSASAGTIFSLLMIVGCFLVGSAGICFTPMPRATRAMAGIAYTIACPFVLMLAGLYAACSIGDCL